MRLVLTTVFDGNEPEAASTNVRFHLAAGADLVVAAVRDDGVATALRSLGDRVRVEEAGTDHAELRTLLARKAATEDAADWVISADPDEFWWPRGENLKEVLAPIPERYTIVQGLRRDFSADGTRRSTPEDGNDAVLRPVFRADPDVSVAGNGSVELRRSVPLRSWYPIEVMYSGSQAQASDDSVLVEDTRLKDALQAIRNGQTSLTFRVPDIVDDARYAVECAAVGEVDLPRLERYVTELEQRVEWLEQRFWPRVLRRVARIAGRSS